MNSRSCVVYASATDWSTPLFASSLMHSPLALRLRRVTALLVLLSLGFFNAESLVADSCDGDAGGVAAVSPHDGSRLSAPSSSEQPSGTQPVGAHHSIHICHCAHAHGGALVAHGSTAVDMVPSTSVIEALSTAPTTVWLEPQFRPPVV